MNRLILIGFAAVTACTGAAVHDATPSSTAPAPTAPALDPAAGPPAVIVLIGDGTGLTYWSALKVFRTDPIAIERFPVVGLVDTEAVGSKITDSAAGATAFSTGVRTYNGAVGVGPDTVPVETVLEMAEGLGWATGVVSTSRITHATPAAFVAHVPSRQQYDEIARQMAGSAVDVMLGGGTDFFDPGVREDRLDLLTVLERRGVLVTTPRELAAVDLDTVRTLTGLFGGRDMPPANTRRPTLPDLTSTALDILEEDEDGFFLMVEASQIDWRGHDNAPLPEVLAEVDDFDRTIARVLEFQDRRPNTLVVVVADHSTGGFALAADSTGVLAGGFTTEGHTAEMVPLFARGPGAEAFGGVMDNDRVGRLLRQVVQSERAGSEPATD